MKAITLWQPWASLIVEGYKAVETRSWGIGLDSIPQILAIHAAKRPIQQLEIEGIICALPESNRSEIAQWLNRYEFPLGSIIGCARLEKIYLMNRNLIDETSPTEKALGLWQEGRFAWILSSPIKLLSPIKCRGYQRLWEVEKTIELKIDNQFEE